MNTFDQSGSTRFHSEMQRALRRQGLSEVTRDSYARALRRLEGQVDVPLDQLGVAHLKDYFSALIESHSWSTVKVDRCGLQFFFHHVLERDWEWLRIVRREFAINGLAATLAIADRSTAVYTKQPALAQITPGNGRAIACAGFAEKPHKSAKIQRKVPRQSPVSGPRR